MTGDAIRNSPIPHRTRFETHGNIEALTRGVSFVMQIPTPYEPPQNRIFMWLPLVYASAFFAQAGTG